MRSNGNVSDRGSHGEGTSALDARESQSGGKNDSLSIRTRGTNVLRSEKSEFAGSSSVLDSLAGLGLRAYNPVELEQNVVEQLEGQLEKKSNKVKEPRPLSAYLEEKRFLEAVGPSDQVAGDGKPKVPRERLVKMQMLYEMALKDQIRTSRGHTGITATRTEQLQVKVNLIKTLIGQFDKREKAKRERLVQIGRALPFGHPQQQQQQAGSAQSHGAWGANSVQAPSPVASTQKPSPQKKVTPPIGVFGTAIIEEAKKKNKKKRKSEDVEKLESQSPSRGYVACPICKKEFSQNRIEKHAARCNAKDEQPEALVPVSSVQTKTNAGNGSTHTSHSAPDDHLKRDYKARVRLANSVDLKYSKVFKTAYLACNDENEAMKTALDQIVAEISEGSEDIDELIEEGEQQGGGGEEEERGNPANANALENIDVNFHVLFGGLKVARRFYAQLFDYQRTGLEWFWTLHRQGTGGILGDEMGLGKTVQVASFLGALKDSNLLQPSLICCPGTTINQWVAELHKWAPRLRVLVSHSSGAARAAGWSRSRIFSSIAKSGDVLVTTYEGLRQGQEDALFRRWGYVILDEGHKIRNPDADITLVCKQLQTVHRIVMTGSPIQNNLKELWSLFDFVSPGRLGTLPMFETQFAIPVNAGGYANANPLQVRMAYRCAMVLKDTIEPFLLRRMKKDVAQDLPEKLEQVLFCDLTKMQRDAYEKFLQRRDVEELVQASISRGKLKGKMTFKLIRALQHICNHPDLYEERMRSTQQKHEHGLDAILDLDENEPLVIQQQSMDEFVHRSGKLLVLRLIMRQWKVQNHRVLLFCQGRMMLDLLERFVQSEGYSYLRMDGNTPIKGRAAKIDTFNDESSGVFVFLLTTKVGGLGINLIGADRVVLYDPDWNPSTDMQARERAWRVGQKKQVTIYRLITSGTIEEKIYHRQIFKQYLTNKILSDPRQRRFLKLLGLRDLFTLGSSDSTDAVVSGKPSPPRKKQKRKREPEAKVSTSYDQTEDLEAAERTATAAINGSSMHTETSDIFNDGRVSLNEANGATDDNNNILKSLFDGSSGTEGGLRQAFSHDLVEESTRSEPDRRIVEDEATKVARQAALALQQDQNRLRRTASNVHVPTWTGQNGDAGRFGGAASSAILAQLRTRATGSTLSSSSTNAMDPDEGPITPLDPTDKNFIVAKRLRDFLQASPRSTKTILAKFKDETKEMEPELFRQLLRQMSTCLNGVWTLNANYQ